MQKRVIEVAPSPPGHWVGDGFPVRSLFTYDGLGLRLSPFLMLDYAGPAEFPPAHRPRGVGEHPHRGFETVTLVYAGELAHRDSAGHGGVIGPGDVQWMTAASGVVHEEFHSERFTRQGGVLEAVQLWVNLPATQKMAAPRYQAITSADIPVVELDDGAARVRVIAGLCEGKAGAANTATPLDVWDVALRAGRKATLTLPEGRTAALALLRGRLKVEDAAPVAGPAILVLGGAGRSVPVEAEPGEDAVFLVLSGEPIHEPVVGYGPFVMNSVREIEQAMEDYRRGRFGAL